MQLSTAPSAKWKFTPPTKTTKSNPARDTTLFPNATDGTEATAQKLRASFFHLQLFRRELFTLDVVQNDRYGRLGILRILPGLHPTVEVNPMKYHAATRLRV